MKYNFIIWQIIKMIMQNIFLPICYKIYSYKKINDNLVIFADAHHKNIPFSMRLLHDKLATKYLVIDIFFDSQRDNPFIVFYNMIRFMKYYASAKYVVICDTFIPVCSCKKRRGTKVIQLWHGAGILKKFAYDTYEDIPKFYKGNIYANYDLVTVSSDLCAITYKNAMKLADGVAIPTGISRTDIYFDETYIENCKKKFYAKYPVAKGKKIILWAPTFRGNAAMPYLEGIDIIDEVSHELSNDYYFIKKVHPHIDKWNSLSNNVMPTEELLPVADILVTDYSTILFDYILLNKPLILFIPDFSLFDNRRGFYIDLKSIPAKITFTKEELIKEIYNDKVFEYDLFKKEYISACDGKSTDRIISYMENMLVKETK